MHEFLDSILAFPTSIFTGVLGLVVLYWITVMMGVLDLDMLDFDVDVGDVGGGLDGVDGGLDGGADGGDFDADADANASQPGGIAGIIHALGLAGVPLTISGSIVALVGWLASNLVMRGVGAISPTLVTSLPVGIVVAFAAFFAGTFVASRAIRPLRPIFATQHAALRSHFVGKLCEVTTLKVTKTFGQGEIEDGGAGQLVQLRCFEDNALTRGDQALIFDYDPEDEVFHVVPAADRELAKS